MRFLRLAVFAALCFSLPAVAAEDVESMIRKYDQAMRFPDEIKSLAYLEVHSRDQKTVREAVFYSRGTTQREFLMLVTRPKAEGGNGYLRLDRNLWSYDARVGRWERRTKREKLAGTDLIEDDLDKSWLDLYDATYDGEEKVGSQKLKRITLKAKPDVDVSFPMVRLWLDENYVARKQQDFALSGKLLRTVLVPKFIKIKSKVKSAEIWYPAELRIFDEVDKDRSTIVLIKQYDLSPFPSSQFTKAWLESKSR